jgi:hypothetical protein
MRQERPCEETTIMTTDQALLFGLFGLVFALLLWGRWRYDLIASRLCSSV